MFRLVFPCLAVVMGLAVPVPGVAAFTGPTGAGEPVFTDLPAIREAGASRDIPEGRDGPAPKPVQLASSGELDRAIRIVSQQTRGQVVRAETRIEGGEPVHHVRILTPDGRVENWRVDRNGRILD